MMRFHNHLQWIDQQHDRMATLLQDWAVLNTGSYHLLGLRNFAQHLHPLLQQLSPDIVTIPLPAQCRLTDQGLAESRPLGDALSLRSPARTGPRVLLAIHYDTVFAPDHPFQSVTSIDHNTLRGPGVCDAKGGLLVLLFSLLALERSPFAKNLNWEILLNPDEELGSPGSAPLFADAAHRNDLALLFEPALPDGALVSSRKGSGNFTLLVHGRAAHAGRDGHLGRNAIHALSSLIGRLTDISRDVPGSFLNTGFIHGGGPVNVVPDLALCRFNIRVETLAQQHAIESRLAALTATPLGDGITVELDGSFRCPPKPLTPATQLLLHQLQDCAAQLHFPLTHRPTGGVCDGNRLAALGLPTVDSLGVRGGQIHTDQEFIHLDSLTERTRLVALYMMRLAADELALPPKTLQPEVPHP